MKGVLLAGGTGSRLLPLTKVTNKHLLPVYNKPMIFYPLQTLVDLGIKDILVITSAEFCGHISQLLGSGKQFNVDLSYKVQDRAGGIAEALHLAKNFACESNIAVILGDNIFMNKFNSHIADNFTSGCGLFLKEVTQPQRFGVAEIENNKITCIQEKPSVPKSNLAVTGLYMYDYKVFSYIEKSQYSARGELEITDVNNMYIQNNAAKYVLLDKEWTDAGTHESLFRANQIVKMNG